MTLVFRHIDIKKLLLKATKIHEEVIVSAKMLTNKKKFIEGHSVIMFPIFAIELKFNYLPVKILSRGLSV